MWPAEHRFLHPTASPSCPMHPETICFPSGEKEQLTTGPLCPARVASDVPDATSHNRSVQSAEADMSRLPSGEKAQAWTASSWPRRMHSTFPLLLSHSFSACRWEAETM